MVPVSASFRDGTPDGAAFGEFLRQARERRGLTLQQISSETKIPWRHLDALEHGQLNAVPGGTYRRGEIRAYAEVVGLDKAAAIERLERALQASTPAIAPAQPSTYRSIPAAALLRLALAVFAIVLLVMLVAREWRTQAASTTQPVTVHETTSGAPAVAATHQAPATPPAATPVAPVQPASAAPAADEPAGAVAGQDLQPPPVADAGLTITSDPPGARVTVDGIAWGTTPLTVAHLPLGARRVRVTLPSFEAAERMVRLTGERPTNAVHVELQPARQ